MKELGVPQAGYGPTVRCLALIRAHFNGTTG